MCINKAYLHLASLLLHMILAENLPGHLHERTWAIALDEDVIVAVFAHLPAELPARAWWYRSGEWQYYAN
jgi:hypothetical protein